MHSGAIPDSSLRASSSYDDSSVGPSYGRYALRNRFLDVLSRHVIRRRTAGTVPCRVDAVSVVFFSVRSKRS